ncbi:hypothetical protein E24_00019 [Faustovirus]|nr:hypothetical protein PRJ_Fausto_00019 [Faustovirus]AMN82955.1 hypothetical protein E24_00019 [Faustovirus]AMN83941.1 hypothetical protein D5a_00019 [Faustovirus]AMN84926.1 hypothetical protein E23_00019 [Faustovirus]QBR98912.1 hypothetical protein [Faustovirus mariensis]
MSGVDVFMEMIEAIKSINEQPIISAKTDKIIYDVLYTASIKETLLSQQTESKCRVVAYDDPIEAVKHFYQLPRCTLFTLRVEDGWSVDSAQSRKVYTYIGPGNMLSVVQKITLCPTNYLNDWVDMNHLANTKLSLT